MGEPSPKAVADYLRAHPDFLVDNPDLASVLAPPRHRSAGNGVADLQHFMVERERHRNAELVEAMRELLDISRSNRSSQTLIHDAVLGIAAVGDFGEVVRAISEEWPGVLDCDAAMLGFEGDGGLLRGTGEEYLRRLGTGRVDQLMEGRRTVRLEGNLKAGPQDVFGPASGLVSSLALLRLDLGGCAPAGLLALSSREAGHFCPNQGTDLLVFLARFLSGHLAATLDRVGPP